MVASVAPCCVGGAGEPQQRTAGRREVGQFAVDDNELFSECGDLLGLGGGNGFPRGD